MKGSVAMKNLKKRVAVFAMTFIVVIVVATVMVSSSANAASNMKLNKTKLTLVVGSKKKLKVKNTSKAVIWTSSNKNVAQVNKNGHVTAKSKGKSIITAKIGDTKLSCVVKVKKAINDITVDMTIENAGLKGLTYFADEIYCNSSNPDVATAIIVDDGCVNTETGKKEASLFVYGYKTGTSLITITNSNNDQAEAFKVTVKKPAKENAYQKLVDYILLNGTVDASLGDKKITRAYDRDNAAVSVIYDPMEYIIDYEYSETNHFGKVDWLVMPTEKDNTEVYIVMWIYPNGSEEEHYVTAKVDALTYAGEELTYEKGWFGIPVEDSLQRVANIVTENAFSRLDELLEDEVGMTWEMIYER